MSNPDHVIAAGAFMAFLAVALGAFAAHGLKQSLGEYELSIFRTGVDYHMMHALGLVLIGILMRSADAGMLGTAAVLMFVGILLFSGSLYILSISGIKWLGAITPLGGLCFLAAWLAVCWAMLSGN